MRRLSPTGSYFITVPDEAVVEVDERVTSIWIPGTGTALQLSSLVRHEGEQIASRQRLEARVERESIVDVEEVSLDVRDVDFSAAGFIGSDGLYWVYAYLTWPTRTVFVTVSGLPNELENKSHWPFEAIRSIECRLEHR